MDNYVTDKGRIWYDREGKTTNEKKSMYIKPHVTFIIINLPLQHSAQGAK